MLTTGRFCQTASLCTASASNCRGTTRTKSQKLVTKSYRAPDCALQTASLYESALELAREERYEAARQAFELVVAACPQWYLPWVSYAQMERRAWATDPIERWHRCRGVLQRALALNPHSPHITQAWGLMELQRGNFVPAIVLLERCAGADRRCEPVLRWKLVRDAKQLVSVRRRR